MNRYFLMLLILICFKATAQRIDFDLNDTAYREYITIDTVNFKNNKWQIGRPSKVNFTSAYTLPNAIVTDTLLPCSPHDTSVFTLKIRGGGPGFTLNYTFWHKLDIDTGDVAKIEFSVDTGKHWHNVLDTFVKFVGDRPDFSNNPIVWKKVVMDPDYQTMFFRPWYHYMRFILITGNSPKVRDGWMLDSFSYKSVGDGIEHVDNALFSFYPNPVNKTVNIRFSQQERNAEIALFDMYGKCVKYINAINTNSAKVDVGDILPGMYICRMITENKQATKTMIITH